MTKGAPAPGEQRESSGCVSHVTEKAEAISVCGWGGCATTGPRPRKLLYLSCLPRLRGCKNNHRCGENAAKKRGHYAPQTQGSSLPPWPGQNSAAIAPSRPALQQGPDGKPRARGGEGEAEGGRSGAL